MLKLDDRTWKILNEVNREGNRITWQSDQKTWGLVEKWALPKEVGNRRFEDCDGISLFKMKAAIENGIDPDSLSMVICLASNGEGHAVLCVITDKGDYILDNNFPSVMPYPALLDEGYRFLYRSVPSGKLGEDWERIDA